jgi:hypothetical protein
MSYESSIEHFTFDEAIRSLNSSIDISSLAESGITGTETLSGLIMSRFDRLQGCTQQQATRRSKPGTVSSDKEYFNYAIGIHPSNPQALIVKYSRFSRNDLAYRYYKGTVAQKMEQAAQIKHRMLCDGMNLLFSGTLIHRDNTWKITPSSGEWVKVMVLLLLTLRKADLTEYQKKGSNLLNIYKYEKFAEKEVTKPDQTKDILNQLNIICSAYALNKAFAISDFDLSCSDNMSSDQECIDDIPVMFSKDLQAARSSVPSMLSSPVEFVPQTDLKLYRRQLKQYVSKKRLLARFGSVVDALPLDAPAAKAKTKERLHLLPYFAVVMGTGDKSDELNVKKIFAELKDKDPLFADLLNNMNEKIINDQLRATIISMLNDYYNQNQSQNGQGFDELASLIDNGELYKLDMYLKEAERNMKKRFESKKRPASAVA